MASSRVLQRLKFERYLFFAQLTSIAVLAIAAVGVWLVEMLVPSFFNYPYLDWGGWSSVARFWPLFAWGVGINLVVYLLQRSESSVPIHYNQELLGWELLTSILAGFWEELGFRWAFICFAMIGIYVLNVIFGTVLAWMLVVACTGALIYCVKEEEWLPAIFCLVLGVIAAVISFHANPIYWIYATLVWIIHFTTFTLMDPILYGGHEQLLVFGAIVANSWFRDGHKYQGTFGLVNSWYAGMVLLYAALTYGLITAIVIHALYDMAIALVRFTLQKTH